MANSTHLVGQYLPASTLSAHNRAKEVSMILARAVIESLHPIHHDTPMTELSAKDIHQQHTFMSLRDTCST